MLDCLWLDAFVRRHRQQHGVDAGGAGDHGADEALVAGHVDDVDLVVIQAQVREAERDRDAAAPLLRQAVGVGAGKRADQRGLAVIDVADHAEQEAPHGQGSALDPLGPEAPNPIS